MLAGGVGAADLVNGTIDGVAVSFHCLVVAVDDDMSSADGVVC